MLTRAAKRKHALQYIEKAAETLQLPWLCPALSHSSLSSTQRRTSSSRPALTRPERNPSRSPSSRRFASATSIAEDIDHHDEYLPFAYEQKHSSVPSYDLSNLLMIDHTTVPDIARRIALKSADHHGAASDIEATLEACLQVQRWNRAFHILDQLSQIFLGNTSKLQRMYNRVLEAMVFDLIWNRNTENQEKINQWIEVYMSQVGVEPNAHTFALKIKMALATLEGSRRTRTVKRYWKLAQEYQFESQVASLRNILSDSDLGKLTEICPLEVGFELEKEAEATEQDTLYAARAPNPDASTAVRETEQKGLGLVSLRQALNSFQEVEEGEVLDLDHSTELLHSRQLKLERDSLRSAVDRWKIEHEKRLKIGVAGNLEHGKLGALSWHWYELLTQKIEKELELVEEAEASVKQSPEDRLRCEYGPFLRLLSPQHLSALTTISTIQIMSKLGLSKTIKVARLVTEIGRAVENEVESHYSKANKSLKRASNSKEHVEEGTLPRLLPEAPVLHQSSFQPDVHWTNNIRAKVGAIVCELFFDVAKILVSKEDTKSGKVVTIAEPVFRRQLIWVQGRRSAIISTNPAFADVVTKEPPADVIAKQLPMLSKPRSWTGFSDGGYLESKQPVLRVKHDDSAQRDYAKAAADRGDLDQLFKGLDVLGSTGWKINSKVFEVMLEAWNSGEAVANLPPIDKVFPPLEKPSDDAKPTEKWQYYKKLRAMENQKGGLHSKRCFQNFQMEIARAYLDHTFYLPHNVDFRGRAYPIPPYLNQMGADNARGLMLFSEGRALGDHGLKWLQVHLANVFGYDKASLADRAQFAIDHVEDIRDTVENPLTGRRWWLKAEDPWQCLATCHELLGALDSPDPTAYISHMPIHQDGTCNGLQHYAALGGDIAGARQVNLEPGDKPADVYTGVAELVKAEIKHDAEQGVEIAKLLEGRLVRKIVKQTVMTNVYGVTFTGAVRQVRRQVEDLLPDINESGHGAQAATYIARKIFKGLGTLFEGAHDIQYWLGDCANRITRSISPAQLQELEQKEFGSLQVLDAKANAVGTKGKTKGKTKTKASTKNKKKDDKTIDKADFRSTVIWTTPLKLPVVQPYRSCAAEVVQTSVQGLALRQPSVTDGVDSRKQLQGFPPNFIHSLDATHMMLSALKAQELGLTFSAVHDSFWTHAADVNTLNILLREAFVRMHGEDVIGRLAAEFRARYKGHWYLAKIGNGNELSRAIQHYRSTLPVKSSSAQAQRYHELVREIQRARLLASKDAQERAEGEAMVTAATLFDKHDGSRYLPEKVSLGQTAIGHIPDADPLAVEDALQAEVSDQVDLENALDPFLDDETVETSHEKDKTKGQTWMWLPLTFKDVPQKGNFDVNRLKSSVYFFS